MSCYYTRLWLRGLHFELSPFYISWCLIFLAQLPHNELPEPLINLNWMLIQCQGLWNQAYDLVITVPVNIISGAWPEKLIHSVAVHAFDLHIVFLHLQDDARVGIIIISHNTPLPSVMLFDDTEIFPPCSQSADVIPEKKLSDRYYSLLLYASFLNLLCFSDDSRITTDELLAVCLALIFFLSASLIPAVQDFVLTLCL